MAKRSRSGAGLNVRRDQRAWLLGPRIAELISLSDQNADKTAAVLERARVLLREGRFNEAIQLLSSDDFDGRRFPEALLMLAAAHLSLGKLSEARPFIEQTLRVEPNSSRARWLNAQWLSATGSPFAAAEEAGAAADAAPDNPQMREDHFAMQMRVSPRQARSVADLLAQTFPDWPGTHRCIADLALYEERFLDAENAARRAIELDPRSERAYALVGAALSARKCDREAAEAFALATKLFPASPNAAFNLLILAGRRTRFWARRAVPGAVLAAFLVFGLSFMTATGQFRIGALPQLPAALCEIVAGTALIVGVFVHVFRRRFDVFEPWVRARISASRQQFPKSSGEERKTIRRIVLGTAAIVFWVSLETMWLSLGGVGTWIFVGGLLAIGLAGYPVLRRMYERDAAPSLNLRAEASEPKKTYPFH